MFLRNVFAVLLTVFSVGVLAQEKSITFSGLVKNPDGSVPADEVTTVEVAVLSSKDVPTDNVCVLRHEKFTGVQVRDGSFTVQIGTGDTAFSGHLNPSSVLPLSSVLSGAAKTGLNCFDPDENPLTAGYTPGAGHGRKVRAIVTLGGQTVTADFSMNANAFSFHADNANKVGGKSVSELIVDDSNVTQTALTTLVSKLVSGDLVADKFPGIASASCSSGQYVKSISETGALTCEAPSASSETDPTVQAFAKVSVGSGIRLHAGTNALEADIGASSGQIVALDGSGKLPAVDGSQLTNLPTVSSFTGSLVGDVTGNQGTTRVEAIRNQPITADGSDAGQVLRYAGSGNWTPGFVGMLDLRSNTTGSTALSSTCTPSQTLTYNSAMDNLSCQAIGINSSQISDWGTATQNFLTVSGGQVSIPFSTVVRPAPDESVNLGSAMYKFGSVYAGNILYNTKLMLNMATGKILFNGTEKVDFSSANELRFNTQRLTNVSPAISNNDVVTKIQLDNAMSSIDLGAYLPKDGSVSLTGNLLPDGSHSLGSSDYPFNTVNTEIINIIRSTSSVANFTSVDANTAVLNGSNVLNLNANGNMGLTSGNALSVSGLNGVSISSSSGNISLNPSSTVNIVGQLQAMAGGKTLVFNSAGNLISNGNASFADLTGSGDVNLGGQTTNTKITLSSPVVQMTGTSTTGNINFYYSNSVTTSFDCANAANEITFTGLRDGGTYTLIVTGAGTVQCAFNTTTLGNGAGSVTYKFSPANGAREAGKHTIYTLMRVGGIVYVSWIAGFN